MFKLFFRLPWFAYLLFALLALAAGTYSFQSAKTMNAHRVAALAGDLPKLIDASAVGKSSFTAADEINVSSQISSQIFTVSVSGRRTVDKSKTTIFALPSDAASAGDTVNVVYMLDPNRSIDEFVGKFATEEGGAMSLILNVNGAAYDPGRKLKKSVRNAADQAGLKLSSNAVFIEPFMDGRKKGLSMDSPALNFIIFAIIGGILALIGLVKLLMNVRRKKKLAKMQDIHHTQTADA